MLCNFASKITRHAPFIRQPPFHFNPHCLKSVSEVALLHRFHCNRDFYKKKKEKKERKIKTAKNTANEQIIPDHPFNDKYSSVVYKDGIIIHHQMGSRAAFRIASYSQMIVLDHFSCWRSSIGTGIQGKTFDITLHF